jgi:hypothetical protein
LKQEDHDREKADKVDSAEDCSRQAVTAVNQPHRDEKGNENDNESEEWAEGLQNNLGGVDPTAVFELDKVRIQQLGSRTGHDPLPVLCLPDRLRRGRRHVSSPPNPRHLSTGRSTFGEALFLNLSETGPQEEGASPR